MTTIDLESGALLTYVVHPWRQKGAWRKAWGEVRRAINVITGEDIETPPVGHEGPARMRLTDCGGGVLRLRLGLRSSRMCAESETQSRAGRLRVPQRRNEVVAPAPSEGGRRFDPVTAIALLKRFRD